MVHQGGCKPLLKCTAKAKSLKTPMKTQPILLGTLKAIEKLPIYISFKPFLQLTQGQVHIVLSLKHKTIL